MKQSLLLFAAIMYCALFTITRAESLLKQDSSDLFTLTQWSAMRKLEQPLSSTKQITQLDQSTLWWGSEPYQQVIDEIETRLNSSRVLSPLSSPQQ